MSAKSQPLAEQSGRIFDRGKTGKTVKTAEGSEKVAKTTKNIEKLPKNARKTPKSAKNAQKNAEIAQNHQKITKSTQKSTENIEKLPKTGEKTASSTENARKSASSILAGKPPALREKLKTLPVAPGVYLHKNATGEVIYVGKAAVLKNRVRQYFQNTEKDAKTQALVAEIADTDWTTVESEMDALFLESELIKRYRPKWNVLLRDDKNVSFVRINLREAVPAVTLTRTPAGDGATYIGPFYGQSAVARSLRILRKIFPFYDRPYTGRKTLYTDLGLTPGLEIGKSSPAEYKADLRKLIQYLRGGRQRLLKNLEKQMRELADQGEFEQAAKARDQWLGLGALRQKIVFSDQEFLDISSDRALLDLQKLLGLPRPPARIEGYDISHQNGTDAVGSLVVFQNGVSDRAEYRRFKLKKQQNNDLESLREVLRRRLGHKSWSSPDLILVDGGKAQVGAAQAVLAEFSLPIPVLGRDKSGDHGHDAEVVLILPDGTVHALARGSHLARLIARIDEEAHRFAITYHRLLKNRV